jgi:GT2 family glycosyltransferase
MSAGHSLLRSWYEELLQRTYRPRLVPVRELRASDTIEHQWLSTGENPEFHIEPPLPQGWVRLRLKGRASPPALVTCYIERGGERTETVVLKLGSLNPAGSVLDRFASFRGARSARLDPSLGPGYVTIEDFTLQRVGAWRVILHAAASYVNDDRRPNVWRLMRRVLAVVHDSGFSGLRRKIVSRVVNGRGSAPPYDTWLEQDQLDKEARTTLRAAIDAAEYRPTFSLIAVVQNPPVWQLTNLLDSLTVQLYPRWELCVAFDNSTPEDTRAVLERYAAEDARIRITPSASERPSAAALNVALGIVTGEFIANIDEDAELSPDALLQCALALNERRGADLIYSDEDGIDDTGARSAPYFKPDWSPETLLGDMYMGRLCLYRRSVVEDLKGFREEMSDGAEYDLALRVSESTDRIYHIPRVLYHRRIKRDIVGGGACASSEHHEAAVDALRQAIARRGLRGTVEAHERFRGHHIVRLAADPRQKVSIVIPTRDRADLLERCLSTLFNLTTHPNFEVCVVDNGSQEEATSELFRRFHRLWPEQFRVIRRDVPFNFSALVNAGVAETDGDLVLFLNNDTEVLDGAWLEQMAGYAQRAEIGAVGCVLLYPNRTVQHGGVVLMAGAVAGHSHAGQPTNEPGYFGRLLAQSNYAAVTAACMMVRRELFIGAGGFDEALAVAYNDVDFCLRLLQRGYRNVCLGQVRLVHHESMSRGSDDAADRRARSTAESRLMRERWASVLDGDPYYSPNLRSVPPDFSPAASTRQWPAPSGPAVLRDRHFQLDALPAETTPRWFGSSSPRLLIAGHSHRIAFIDYFNRSGHAAPIAILDQKAPVPLMDDGSAFGSEESYWAVALAAARTRRVPLAIVWGGNWHNAHFLFESDERFSIFPASGPWEDGRPRPLIPRSLIRKAFAPGVAALRAVLEKSAGADVILLGTPPPKADDQVRVGIEGEPVIAEWAARLGMTAATLRITPLSVRRELWKITQELLGAMCREYAVPFIDVPERVFSGGALSAALSAPDVTHANGLWAEVMIKEAHEALAAA